MPLWRVLACSLFAAVTTASANWPQFRAGGGVASGNPPERWELAQGTNVAWRRPIPGLGHSSPIAWDDRVYVTTAVSTAGQEQLKVGSGKEAGIASATDVGIQEWRLYALDRRTGAIIWQQTAERSEPRAQRHAKNSYATATPATDGRRVVAIMGSQGLFCFDAAGKQMWRVDLGALDLGMANDPGTRYGSGSSPIIVGSRIIVQNDRRSESFLAAFDLDTGKELWRTARDEQSSWSTPLVARSGERTLVITNAPRRIRATDLETGKDVWWLEDGSELKVASPVHAGDAVIVTGGFPAGSKPIYAIPLAASGQLTRAQLKWSLDKGSAYTITPIVYDGVLYVATDSGVLSAYDPANGERFYQVRMGDGVSSFSASPVASAGRIYYISEDGSVYVVKAGKTYELVATNTLDAITLATPAIVGNLLVVRTKAEVIAFGTP